MQKELFKLALQALFVAFISWAVSAAVGRQEEAVDNRDAAMPKGNEWVTGIVDGPLAQSSAYVPASTMG